MGGVKLKLKLNMSQWVDSEEIAEKWELTVKEEETDDPMGVNKIKKVEGLGTKGICIRLVLLPRLVGTAVLFIDIVPIKLATLREHCVEKGISLKHPCIPTLSSRIEMKGGEKTWTKPAMMSGLIIQLVGEDQKFGWGMFPILIAMGPSKETPKLLEGEDIKKDV